MVYYTYNKETVVLDDVAFSSGGEGEIHHVQTCPSRFNNVCAKIYFKPQRTADRAKKIRFMVENPPKNIVTQSIMMAWPLETLHDNTGQFIGFIMPTAFPKSNKLVILTTPKLKNSYKDEWYKFDKEYDIKMALVTRLKLINNIAIPVHLLHDTHKYILKDFKPDNVLVTPSGKVTIVDMDSIQICEDGNMLFPGTAATEEYVPPEFYKGVGRDKKPLNESWDSFAVSVVFYKLLFGLNPYVVTPMKETEDSCTIPYCIENNLFPFGNNASKILKFPPPHRNFKIIPQPIQNLFIRSFGDNPGDRPSAIEWVKTIKQVIEKTGSPTNVPPPKQVEEYTLSVVTPKHGKITLSKYKARPGDIITVNNNPDREYKLEYFSYSSTDGTVYVDKKNTFVMPKSNVKVNAVFTKKEEATSNESSGGSGTGLVILKIILWIAAIGIGAAILIYLMSR